MSAFDSHELHHVRTNGTLTFEHTYTWWGHRRKLKVTAQVSHTPITCLFMYG